VPLLIDAGAPIAPVFNATVLDALSGRVLDMETAVSDVSNLLKRLEVAHAEHSKRMDELSMAVLGITAPPGKTAPGNDTDNTSKPGVQENSDRSSVAGTISAAVPKQPPAPSIELLPPAGVKDTLVQPVASNHMTPPRAIADTVNLEERQAKQQQALNSLFAKAWLVWGS
jgi:hypothetical protein